MGQKEFYEKYREHCSALLGQAVLTEEDFVETFGKRLEKAECVRLDEGTDRGTLSFFFWEEEGKYICLIPVYGYCYSSERALTKLFCKLSEQLMQEQSEVTFEVHLYANDLKAQRTFAMMQFAYTAETGLLHTLVCKTEYEIKTLSKDEIQAQWNQIWEMTNGILSHLKQAPIFYPCDEFTEEAYREFFLDEGTNLHVAFDQKGNMIGMIETNGERCGLIGLPSVNVGEVFVKREWRGKGVSASLLSYAYEYERKRSVTTLWVEHGTANPNARAFWGNYFETFEYEMDRIIRK